MGKGKSRWLLCLAVVAVSGIAAGFLLDSTPSLDTSHINEGPALTATEAAEPAVIVHPSTAVPGVIVCEAFDAVTPALQQFVEYMTDDRARNRMGPDMKQKWELMHGKDALPYPDVSPIGCDVIPSGTTIHVRIESDIPVIAAVLPNGSVVRGVTSPAFLNGASQ